MELNKNYYQILGIDKNVDDNEIKKVFRKKANETHPDKHGGDDSEFKIINEAYQILGNKEKRSKYDMQSPHGKDYNPSRGGFNSFFGSQDPFGGFSFSFGGGNDPFDPFEMFFRRNQEFQENLNINITKNITLEDVYNNKEINIKYTRKVTCNICNGNGFDPESDSHECDVCDGSGKNWDSPIGYSKCKYCQGTGRIHIGTCKKCNGEKVIDKEEEFNINNVYRIENNDTKYLKGYGHQSKHYNNKRGDLILNLIYINNDKYLRKREGLYYKLNLHFEDAINGVDLKYNHLDGKEYIIKIPPKTKDGDKLKMSKKGLLIGNNIRQDLYILINIIIDYTRLK
jgi:molecular chaperone DnaJ